MKLFLSRYLDSRVNSFLVNKTGSFQLRKHDIDFYINNNYTLFDKEYCIKISGSEIGKNRINRVGIGSGGSGQSGGGGGGGGGGIVGVGGNGGTSSKNIFGISGQSLYGGHGQDGR